jgi:hypothetical protein
MWDGGQEGPWFFFHHGDTEDTEITLRRQGISVALSRKYLVPWKEFCLADFLASWRLMLIRRFNRQGAKDAKKTPSKIIWLRLCRSVNLSVLLVSVVNPNASNN